MALLPILKYPDPRLRIRAKSVPEVDQTVASLIADMLETMYDAPGIGLAATQVDVHKRVLVLDISEERNQPCCLINPRILAQHGQIGYSKTVSFIRTSWADECNILWRDPGTPFQF